MVGKKCAGGSKGFCGSICLIAPIFNHPWRAATLLLLVITSQQNLGLSLRILCLYSSDKSLSKSSWETSNDILSLHRYHSGCKPVLKNEHTDLAHSLDGYNRQCWDKPEAGVRSFNWVTHVRGRSSNTWIIFCRFSQASEQTAGLVRPTGHKPTFIEDTGITGRRFTCCNRTSSVTNILTFVLI